VSTDLRDEIKRAFDNELAEYPPLPALHIEAMRAVAHPQPRPAPRLEWLAAATAVVVTAAILLSLLASRLITHSTPVGPPPAGLNVFYVLDPKDPQVMVALDWSGTQRGQVKLPRALDPLGSDWIRPAPDGSSFIHVTAQGPDQFLDRDGRLVAEAFLPDLQDASFIWSADSAGVCVVGYSSAAGWQLFTETPTGGRSLVAQLGTGDPRNAQQNVAGCSFADERAIVLNRGSLGVTDARVINLSDGSTVALIEYANPLPSSVIVAEGRLHCRELGEPGRTAVLLDQAPVWRARRETSASKVECRCLERRLVASTRD